MSLPQFIVPQFVDIKPKIFGPIDLRQFITILAGILICFILYKIFPLPIFIVTGVPILLFSIALAFIKINEAPLHLVILNILETLRGSQLYIWQRDINDIPDKLTADKIIETAIPRQTVNEERLRDLALIIDTGGAYAPASPEWLVPPT